MASSGTYTWNPSTYSIITGCLRLLSAIQTGEIPPDDEYQDALDALNGLTKHWQASGIHVWAEQDCTLFFQPGQYQYQLGQVSPDICCLSNAWTQTSLTANAAAAASTIAVASIAAASSTASAIAANSAIGIFLESGRIFWSVVTGVSGLTVALESVLPSPALSGAYVVTFAQAAAIQRPLKVPAARRYQFAAPGADPIETPMMIMSRIDYAAQPQKAVPGIPTQWFYDAQIVPSPASPFAPLGQMNIWPAPENVLSAMKFTAQRPLADFATQANTADLPQEWISSLRFNLAVELAPEYDCPAQRFQMIKLLADEKLEAVKAWDREAEPVLFGVAYDPTSRV